MLRRFGHGAVYFDQRQIIGTIVFLALLFVWVASGFVHSLREAGQFADVTRSPWGAANYWIKAAECTRETGKFLVWCEPGGTVVPIASALGADDPGHTLLLSVLSLVSERPAIIPDVSRVNTVINYAGLVALAAAMCLTGAGSAAALFLLLAVPMLNSWHALTPHPGFSGAACLAAIPTLIIFARAQGRLTNPFAFAASMAVAFAALVAAYLVRQPIGMMGVLGAIIAGAFWLWKSGRNWSAIWGPLSVLAVSIIILWAPAAILKARDLAYGLEQASKIEQHGAAHSLYIGLGAVGNSFGIKWRDEYGLQAAQKVKSDVRYLSDEYYNILKNLYIQAVLSDPLQVIRIYTVKLRRALQTPSPGNPSVRLWKLLAVAAVFYACAHWVGRSQNSQANLLPVTTMSLIFLGCFLVQASVIHYSILYLAPTFLFAQILIIVPLLGILSSQGEST